MSLQPPFHQAVRSFPVQLGTLWNGKLITGVPFHWPMYHYLEGEVAGTSQLRKLSDIMETRHRVSLQIKSKQTSSVKHNSVDQSADCSGSSPTLYGFSSGWCPKGGPSWRATIHHVRPPVTAKAAPAKKKKKCLLYQTESNAPS